MKSIHLIFLFAVFHLVLSTCSAKKNQPRSSAKLVLPSEPSVSPSTFKCIAVIINTSSDDSLSCRYYTIVIKDVLERGSSLIYQPAQQDSLLIKDCNTNFHRELKTGDTLKAIVEERLKLNSEMPDFILRQIMKQ